MLLALKIEGATTQERQAVSEKARKWILPGAFRKEHSVLWYEPGETHFGLLIFSMERVNLLNVWSPVTAAIGNKQRRRRRQTRSLASKSKCFPWSEGWSQATFKGAALDIRVSKLRICAPKTLQLVLCRHVLQHLSSTFPW